MKLRMDGNVIPPGYQHFDYTDLDLAPRSQPLIRLSLFNSGGIGVTSQQSTDAELFILKGKVLIVLIGRKRTELLLTAEQRVTIPAFTEYRSFAESEAIAIQFSGGERTGDIIFTPITNVRQGYTKWRFENVGLPNGREVSVFDWKKSGESVIHDHSVAETTHVVKSSVGIREVYRTQDGIAESFYENREHFVVPAGRRHRVHALDDTITFNYCDGPLLMNTFSTFLQDALMC